ncbi:YpdA family putative bacillithiol disulfide reductase [Cohnella lubricantis]|uniref:YpdA family putative bacillithiol disulfide reductase n=1 Tax=Cohnella lubricantis TaxID=2163172 RepID=A0A841TBL5_9BACL|nr:YpdA family putative bacillithiol disulfide reductase [Cohnella lubricantis]MBB6676768.1 YpdA family putative bacillithiol disulfide reductase [Cohnella lubricantis]
MEDVIIIGAGPCGLSAAAELQDKGFNPLIIEKENIAYSISCYPTNMQFFSTAPNLEIAGVPFVTPNDKPSRLEALHYYRIVSERRELRIRRYERVTAVVREENGFRVESETRAGVKLATRTGAVVVATGYFDHPNWIGIPGEDLPHVSHFFRESHPYAGTRVTIIGGSNSAVDAALELERVGANVTVVYRGESVSDNIKPWVRPLFEGKVAKGAIQLLLQSRVAEIGLDWIRVEKADSSAAAAEGEQSTLPADFVLALTGFRPDRAFLRAMGVDAPDGVIPPAHNPETMETNVPGIYLAGVVSTGRDANEIFIESGRFHGRMIAEHLAAKRAN